VVWDNAGSHRAREVREVGVALVYLPAYSPELNPVERVFCEVRCCVAGVVYGLLGAQVAAVVGALGGLREGIVRLVGWDWIREALETCRVIDELWCGDWYYHSVSMYDAKALPKKR